MLEWIAILGPTLISWPVVALLAVVIFRKPLLLLFERFASAAGSKAEVGPLKIELGKLAEEGKDAVSRLNRTTELMAESRLLELEITSQMFGQIFSAEQQTRMRRQIEELKVLTGQAGPNSTAESDARKSGARRSL
jgi:hypothetical protein